VLEMERQTKRLAALPRVRRLAAHTASARAKEGKKQRQHANARSLWHQTLQPESITRQVFADTIQPPLATISTSAIASAIGVSRWYAGRIRRGHRPHPRHWQALAELVNLRPEVMELQ
jgi:hypothetical protein